MITLGSQAETSPAARPSRIASIRDTYVPRSPAGRTLTLVTVGDAIGTGLYLAGAVVYFVHGIGLSATQVGTGLTIAGIAGFVATVPLGVLGDRIGARQLLMALQVWRAVWFVALAFVHGPVAFAVVAALLSVGERSASPVTQAVVASVMDGEERVHTMASMRSVRNVGYSLGALLTAPLLAVDNLWAYRSIVLADAASFLLALALLTRLPKPEAAVAVRRPVGPLTYLRGLRDWRFMSLSGLNGGLSLHMSLLSIGLPLSVTRTGAPTALVSLLVALNTVMAASLQVPFSRGSDRPGYGRRGLRRAGVALAVCCLLIAVGFHTGRALTAGCLVLATIALTAAELSQSAASWHIAFTYSPEDRKAEYLGMFSLGATAEGIVGPLLVTLAVAHPGPGWPVLAGGFLVLTALVAPTIAMVARSQGFAHAGVPATAAAS